MNVSIVMPVHGRAALTRHALDALLGGALAEECELIVVNDASTDSTAELLASYGDRIRLLELPENQGYGGACNAGAALARTDRIVFLNNDTEPRPGWLEALLRYADAHPEAWIVGAKLLYPNGTIQHAGVAIGQDGYPHNLYAGLPADHPAASRSRRLQAVTGACMLVQRAAFEYAGGFDDGYLNSLEDVDLCLRVAEQGGEVHYCHEVVLTHLESATRGHGERFERSVARWRERWRERAVRDDLAIYAEDGLLQVEYGATYPLRMSVSPLLAAIGGDRQAPIEVMLEAYAGQVADLMAEVVRLTAQAGRPLLNPAGRSSSQSAPIAFDCHEFQLEANRLEALIGDLQRRLQDAQADAGDVQPPFRASSRLGYRHMVERVRSAAAQIVPGGSAVLVVSRGDRELLKLGDLHATHFPQDPAGEYLGHHPRDSQEAIARLEELRDRGAEYLLLPASSYWWLEHYAGFARHLCECYTTTEMDVCSIFSLRREDEAAARGRS